jgi:hypothetical protein
MLWIEIHFVDDWKEISMLLKTSHLRGFAIRAADGELGHVDEFYFDDKTWAIRYPQCKREAGLTAAKS